MYTFSMLMFVIFLVLRAIKGHQILRRTRFFINGLNEWLLLIHVILHASHVYIWMRAIHVAQMITFVTIRLQVGILLRSRLSQACDSKEAVDKRSLHFILFFRLVISVD